MIGDVLLVKGTKKLIPNALVAAQKVIYRNTSSSHVAFSIGDGVFIHATSKNGVHLTFFPDELMTCNDEWRVIRLKGISNSDKDELAKSSLFYLRQNYNNKFMGSGCDDASFCSELVAKIYRDAKIHILNKRDPSKIAPAHFDEQADLGTNWEDVTSEYSILLKEIQNNEPSYRMIFHTIQGAIAKRNMASTMRAGIFQALHLMADDSKDQGLINLIESQKKFLEESRNLHFWDELDTKPLTPKIDGEKKRLIK
jgi:hypothetical protein